MRNPDELWREYAKEAEDFIVSHRREPKMTQKERFMAAWLAAQRSAMEQGKLCEWKRASLLDIDELSSGAVPACTIRKLHTLELYVAEHGGLPSHDADCSSLYKWLKRMVILAADSDVPRVLRKRMEEIGVDFSNREWAQSRSHFARGKQFDNYNEFCRTHNRPPHSTGEEASLYRWAYRNRDELMKRGLPVVGKKHRSKRETAESDSSKLRAGVSAQRWLISLTDLARFLEENKRLPKEADDPILFRWVSHQEKKASNGSLADWKLAALAELGLTLKTVKVDFSWEHSGSLNKEEMEGKGAR